MSVMLQPIADILQQRTVHFQMPSDAQALVNEYKGKQIDGEFRYSSCNLTRHPMQHCR